MYIYTHTHTHTHTHIIIIIIIVVYLHIIGEYLIHNVHAIINVQPVILRL